jgi:hypothetical protein
VCWLVVNQASVLRTKSGTPRPHVVELGWAAGNRQHSEGRQVDKLLAKQHVCIKGDHRQGKQHNHTNASCLAAVARHRWEAQVGFGFKRQGHDTGLAACAPVCAFQPCSICLACPRRVEGNVSSAKAGPARGKEKGPNPLTPSQGSAGHGNLGVGIRCQQLWTDTVHHKRAIVRRHPHRPRKPRLRSRR